MSIELKGIRPVASAIISGSIAFKPQKIMLGIVQPEHIVAALADTKRNLAAEEQIMAENCRNISRNNCVTADTMRWEGSCETANAEMCRCLGVTVHGVANTSRETMRSNEVVADTYRQVESSLQGTSTDTLREIYADEKTVAGAVRSLARMNSLAADAERNLKAVQAARGGAERVLSKIEHAMMDIGRQVVKSETVLVATERTVNSPLQAATAATARQAACISQAEVNAERDLSKWEVAHGDTVIILPYHFAIDVNKGAGGGGSIDDIPQQNISGIRSVTLSLNERTLADTFQMETTSPLSVACR